jgi:hypothetical protein
LVFSVSSKTPLHKINEIGASCHAIGGKCQVLCLLSLYSEHIPLHKYITERIYMNITGFDPYEEFNEPEIDISEPELIHYLTSDDEYLEPGCSSDFDSE